MSKPQFVFLGMDTCGHCVSFKSKPTPQTSVWSQLIQDKELQSKVDFVFIKHGFVKDEAGNTQRHVLPAEYDHVKYGPFFQLQPANYSTENRVFEEMVRVPRSLPSIKKWILDTLKAKPALTQKSAPKAKRTPVQKPPAKAIDVAPRPAASVDQKQQSINQQMSQTRSGPPKVTPGPRFTMSGALSSDSVVVPKAKVEPSRKKFIMRNE